LESISIHRDEPNGFSLYENRHGSDRMLHSTADSLEEVMAEQDLIKAVNYVCMTKANLDLE
jgi:hypothetical protein